jgi:hypothetical protein
MKVAGICEIDIQRHWSTPLRVSVETNLLRCSGGASSSGTGNVEVLENKI